MKNFVRRLFLVLCGMTLMTEGLILLSVRMGYLSLEKILNWIITLFRTQKGLDAITTASLGLVVLGAVLLVSALLMMKKQKTIKITNDGEMVVIPVDAVKDFIEQSLKRISRFKGIKTSINKKGRWLVVVIQGVFAGDTSITSEIESVKDALRKKLQEVFEFSQFKLNFHVKGISSDVVNSIPLDSRDYDESEPESSNEREDEFDRPTDNEEAKEPETVPPKKGLFGKMFKK
jgi:hypothetical protein